MNKKILILLSLTLPLYAAAQTVSLDNLFALDKNNYCLNISQGKYKNIYEAFNLNDKSLPMVAGLKVQNMAINYPTVSVVNSGAQLAQDLAKSDSKKYSEKDLSANPIKDTYAIFNSIDLRFSESPGELMNKLSNAYTGLNFKTEALGGGYLFKQEKPIDLANVKNIVEFNKEYNRYVSAALTFTISGLKGEFKGSSVLSYECIVNVVTATPITDISTALKGKVVTK